MNPGDGEEYILVLSGFNLDLSRSCPALPFTMSALWKSIAGILVPDGIPECSSSHYCISQALLMKGKVPISTFPVFLIDPLTCAEHAEYVDVRRSTNQLYELKPLKFTSTPRVYDI